MRIKRRLKKGDQENNKIRKDDKQAYNEQKKEPVQGEN